ncbi:MAG: hypothetical protein H7Y00_13955 [Fimbriimonadaceae bacterium]|nr:hypothetical protein [Chitinophagales bacterium]
MKKIVTSFFIIFGVCAVSFAQNSTATASISENFQIVLPADKPLSETYLIDISGISFKNEEDCVIFFDKMHEIVVNYDVLYQNKQVLLKLSYDKRNEGWQLEDWNKYFAGRAKKMQAVYASINQ